MAIVTILQAMSRGGAAPLATTLPLVVFSGESNSGGYALNSQAQPSEIGSRPSIRILNNTTLAGFDTLHISTVGDGQSNTHVGHAQTESFGPVHGWELELANKAANGDFSINPVYLAKTGQGGSKIADWNEAGAYYTNFKSRLDAAISLRTISAENKFALFYTQGINDAIAGTNADTWKANTIAHFTKMRQRYGMFPIVMTKIPDNNATYTSYNAKIAEIANEVSLCRAVEVSDLSKRDANHWDYAGMKTMLQRMYTKLTEMGYRL